MPDGQILGESHVHGVAPNQAGLDDWKLGRFQRRDREVQFTALRSLAPDEVQELLKATALLSRFDSRYLLRPIYDAANSLSRHAAMMLGAPGRYAYDPDAGQRLGLLFDQWLNQLPLYRFRVTRNVGLYLGDEAQMRVKTKFFEAIHGGGFYSLAYEFRNCAQHFADSLSFTHLESESSPDGSRTASWLLNVPEWLAADLGMKRKLRSAFSTFDLVQVLDMVGGALDELSSIMGDVYLHNATRMDAAAEYVLGLFGEAYVDETQTPIVMLVKGSGANGRPGLLSHILLDPVAAGSIAAATDTARELAGIPPKYGSAPSLD